MTWPVKWPAAVDVDKLDPNIRALCELYAVSCMKALTLHRAGGDPVTIIPGSRDRISGRWAWFDGLDGLYPYGRFYPGTFYPTEQELLNLHRISRVSAITLPGPVGEVTEVIADGRVLAPAEYRIEDGQYLVRLDGRSWPAGDRLQVTYYNSYPVNDMGAHAAGVMAAEWLKLITGDKKCRLPSTATSVSRQGISIEKATGMFPGNVTGIPEIDAYLMLLNPHSLRVAPRVFSLDLPQDRQVWHA